MFMLEAVIYNLLKKHFHGQSYYIDVLELFLETTFQIETGQLINLITAPEDKVDLSKFSLKKCILFSIGSHARIDYSIKTFTYCDLQNCILILLPPCCPHYVHIPCPPILPL